MDNIEATKKVLRLKDDQDMTVDYLASILGMSKTTMYTRLKTGQWKITERALIATINEKNF